MPRKRTSSYLPLAAKLEFDRMNDFIKQNKGQVPGLNATVAERTGMSRGMVSQTLNGYVDNPAITKEAHRQICIHLGFPDPEALDAMLPAGETVSGEVQAFIVASNTVRETHAQFSGCLLEINRLLEQLEGFRRKYKAARSTLNFHLDTEDRVGIPDILETTIREEVRSMVDMEAQPKLSIRRFKIPGIQDPGETNEEFAIRTLKEQGYITDEGTLPDDSVYVDPETGEAIPIGRD